jgi:acyl-coenzyme A thioesterase PaaI-like protein
MNLELLIRRAQMSALWLKLLNWSLSRMIPFNRPHGFVITQIDDDSVQVKLPYRRSNFNHIRGLHACALATLAEFTSGFMLVRKLDARKYRLVMKKMEMEYHYQGRSNAHASFKINDTWLLENVMRPLADWGSAEVICRVELYDAQQNHLATGQVCWHIKPWKAVRTPV